MAPPEEPACGRSIGLTPDKSVCPRNVRRRAFQAFKPYQGPYKNGQDRFLLRLTYCLFFGTILVLTHGIDTVPGALRARIAAERFSAPRGQG